MFSSASLSIITWLQRGLDVNHATIHIVNVDWFLFDNKVELDVVDRTLFSNATMNRRE